MRKINRTEVVIWAVIICIWIGSFIWFVNTPAKEDTECKTEYVQQYGSDECEMLHKAAENEASDHTATEEAIH